MILDTTIRILILEDEPTDAELTERELAKAGINFQAKRVENRDTFMQALEEFQPDLILADYKLPAFDGLTAMQLAQQYCPEVPYIFVTGKMGEEFAIETLRQGATDYVLKDQLMKLGPVVQRALAEAEIEKKRVQAEEALRIQLDETERLNRLMVGRELKMEQMRREIEQLTARIAELEKRQLAGSEQ